MPPPDDRTGRRGPGKLRIGGALRLRGRFVHVHSAGDGRPVLLVHGCGSLGQDMLGDLPPVEGVRWIAPDRPGYGFSEPMPMAGPEATADWLADLIDVMDLGPVQVVAHSLASGPALWLAAAQPASVRAVTLLAPLCRVPRRFAALLGLLAAPGVGPLLRRHLLHGGLARAFAPDIPASLVRGGLLNHLFQDQTIAAMRAELRTSDAGMSRMARPVCPVQVMVGSADRIAPPQLNLSPLKTVAPGLTVVEIEGAGHDLHRTAARRVLAAILQQAEASRPRRPTRVPGPATAGCPSGWRNEDRAR